MIGGYVIEQAGQRGIFLGLTGWVAQRAVALSFDDEVSAQDWLADWRITRAKLVGTAAHKILHKPLPVELPPDSRVQTDWNPYGFTA